jgi:hypothetical protein
MIAARTRCSLAKIAAATQSNPPPAHLAILPIDPILGARKESGAEGLLAEGERVFVLAREVGDFIGMSHLHYRS